MLDGQLVERQALAIERNACAPQGEVDGRVSAPIRRPSVTSALDVPPSLDSREQDPEALRLDPDRVLVSE